MFTCNSCGAEFSVPQAALDKYPGWKPRTCLKCRDKQKKTAGGGGGGRSRGGGGGGGGSSSTKELNLPLAEVLARFDGGPSDGVFTDGACSGNPGPGGWGVVWVRGGEVVAQRHGHEAQTTNNRMELTALINAYELLGPDDQVTIWTDSQLCVNTINQWAAGWKKRGWRRKTGPIKNLELVKRAYELAQAHPRAELKWIKAHDGARWNEYADSLATAYLRDEL